MTHSGTAASTDGDAPLRSSGPDRKISQEILVAMHMTVARLSANTDGIMISGSNTFSVIAGPAIPVFRHEPPFHRRRSRRLYER